MTLSWPPVVALLLLISLAFPQEDAGGRRGPRGWRWSQPDPTCSLEMVPGTPRNCQERSRPWQRLADFCKGPEVSLTPLDSDTADDT